jgi:predicted alpha/beta hydrolase
MAKKDNSTAASDERTCHGIDFHKWGNESLLSFIDGLADEINEHETQIAAIAYGGKAYAGSPDSSGNPIDSTCENMFGAIVSMSESAKRYHMLKDAIKALADRAAPSSKGGA